MTTAALVGLCLSSFARTVRFPERVMTDSSGSSRASRTFRPSTAAAVMLIIDMDAKSQQKEQRQLFNPYYYLYHPRLLPDEPVRIPHATKWVWIRLADYLSLRGVYWVHGFVGPDGVWYPQYGRKLNRVPGIEDPSEISDIGWERMLSRVPGVVVR